MSKRFAAAAVVLAVVISLASACIVILRAPAELPHMRYIVLA